MRRYKLVVTAMLLSISILVLPGCSIEEFNPTVFMQQNQNTDQNGDGNNGLDTDSSSSTSDGKTDDTTKNNGLANITVISTGSFDKDITAMTEITEIANISALKQRSELLSFAQDVVSTLDSEDTDGIVVVSDKMNMEDLAFLVSMTENSGKPVVFVSTELSLNMAANGQINLYNAVKTASDTSSKERGVLITQDGNIRKALSMDITENIVGTVLDGKVTYTSESQKDTEREVIDITNWKDMPSVAILYDVYGMDTILLEKAFDNYDGIVIAAAENGAVSEHVSQFINESRKTPMIVRASRDADGDVIQNSGFDDDGNQTIAAGTLSAAKSRILLMLTLGAKKNYDETLQMFQLVQFD